MAVGIGLALWASGLLTCATAQASDRIVVMISVDGLAGFYLEDPRAEMPTIRALAAAGAHSSQMRPSTPSVTWPNHTTLVTGANPARHGVVGNNYLDRGTGKRVRLISDPVFDKEQIVKVPTLYDLAKIHEMKTAAVRWPATRNAPTLDWTIPDMSAGEPMLSHSTPSLLNACARANIPFGHSAKAKDTNETTEVTYTRIFNLILREQRPNLALFHIIEADHIQHLHGPRSPEAYAAIKDVDDRVREVWNELQRDFPDNATLFVVSDHGFSPIQKTLYPNVVLRKAGLLVSATNGPVQIVGQGGAAMVYVLDDENRSRLLRQAKRALSGLEGVSKIVSTGSFKKYGVADPKNDPHAPDLILFAQEGCVFGDTADGDLPFKEKPERSGSHGHDPDLPDLHATLVAWGSGIKAGVDLGKVSNTSVAPTIAELLGFSMPMAEGKPLRKALADRD
jgi:predicted AlkP superfamily pyrophosphatase or phosphodiesterase